MDNKARLLEKYSSRVYKNRKEHVIEIEPDSAPQQIAANARTIPGIITNRGCSYAGCKGVVVGPLKDVCVITHGPVGCGFYSWGTRRNKGVAAEGEQNYLPYCLSTDMQEPDIVFGGEKKLKEAIREAVEIFHPKCIMICSTCPIGLIGDDVHAVANATQADYGIKCIAFSCEGYKGVSQSAGHHIANNGLMKHVIGIGDKRPKTKFSLNILGEYNIGGDGWEQERLLKRIGYEVVSIFTGDGSFEALSNAHHANLNIVMCHRSINYVAEMMEQKYGINWLKVNFIGVDATAQSLRDIAKFFGDEEITRRTEEVIADEIAMIADSMAQYRARLSGKTAGIFVGGSRSHHYQKLLADLGMKTVIAGYEFAHRDDYEGREVIPDIKLDADSKNIESLTMEKHPTEYRKFLSPEREGQLRSEIPLDQYAGMIREMEPGHFVIDDYNQIETELLIKILQPDIFFSGIKDKYIIQKGGTPSRQMHSYDYSGPYAGFTGAVNFARDVDMAIHATAWKLVTPPWKSRPMLSGTLTGGESDA